MNTDRLRTVADRIEQSKHHPPTAKTGDIDYAMGYPTRFSMAVSEGSYEDGNECGTVCCLAGFAAWEAGDGYGDEGEIFAMAQDWLDLDDYQSNALFFPWTGLRSLADSETRYRWREVLPDQGAEVCRRVAERADRNGAAELTAPVIETIWNEVCRHA